MLALLEIRRRRLQFGLVTGVVALISFLVLMVTGLGLGLNEAAGTALLAMNGNHIAYSKGADLSVIRSELGADSVKQISAQNGVRASAVVGYVAAAVEYSPDQIETSALIGVVPGSIAEPPVVEGRALTSDDRRAVLVDRSFIALTNKKIGDSIRVPERLNYQEFTIVGIVDQGYFFFQPAIYLLLDSWRGIKYPGDENAPAGSIVLLQGSNIDGINGDNWVVVSKNTAFWNIEGVQAQQSTVDALRYMGLMIGAMVIGVFFYVITLQKVALLGVLKAIGASTRYLVWQGLLQVLVVSAIGTVLATALALLLDATVLSSDAIPIAFTASAVASTIAAVLVAALVGAALSARQVTSIDPIIAMQQQQ